MTDQAVLRHDMRSSTRWTLVADAWRLRNGRRRDSSVVRARWRASERHETEPLFSPGCRSRADRGVRRRCSSSGRHGRWNEVKHFPSQTMSKCLTLSRRRSRSMVVLHSAGNQSAAAGEGRFDDVDVLMVLDGTSRPTAWISGLSHARSATPPALQSYWFRSTFRGG